MTNPGRSGNVEDQHGRGRIRVHLNYFKGSVTADPSGLSAACRPFHAVIPARTRVHQDLRLQIVEAITVMVKSQQTTSEGEPIGMHFVADSHNARSVMVTDCGGTLRPKRLCWRVGVVSWKITPPERKADPWIASSSVADPQA